MNSSSVAWLTTAAALLGTSLFGGRQVAAQPSPPAERVTLPQPEDHPVASSCHADCRAMRRACRAECAGPMGTVPGDNAAQAELFACASPCEEAVEACIARCDVSLSAEEEEEEEH